MKDITVLRDDGERSWEQTYRVEERKGRTVLEALLEVQDGPDPSPAFRYACHWGVCGSCAMLINGVPRPACRTKLDGADKAPELVPLPGPAESSSEEGIFLAPLPNFPVIKDLVADMRPFFEMYRSAAPWFSPEGEAPPEERTLPREQADRIGRYAGCILCGACHASCPEAAKFPSFFGPAVLTKVYRFAADPREGRRGERLGPVDEADGWSRCKFHRNCGKVCPVKAAPDRAIGRARGELRREKR